jgi:hypothetical protein
MTHIEFYNAWRDAGGDAGTLCATLPEYGAPEHVTLETLHCARCGQHYPQFTGPCGCGFFLECAP